MTAFCCWLSSHTPSSRMLSSKIIIAPSYTINYALLNILGIVRLVAANTEVLVTTTC
jgi:hypothetical protein